MARWAAFSSAGSAGDRPSVNTWHTRPQLKARYTGVQPFRR